MVLYLGLVQSQISNKKLETLIPHNLQAHMLFFFSSTLAHPKGR